MYTRNNTVIMCIVCWILGCGVDAPNFFGWGGHFFDRKSANCMWNRLIIKRKILNKSILIYSIF